MDQLQRRGFLSGILCFCQVCVRRVSITSGDLDIEGIWFKVLTAGGSWQFVWSLYLQTVQHVNICRISDGRASAAQAMAMNRYTSCCPHNKRTRKPANRSRWLFRAWTTKGFISSCSRAGGEWQRKLPAPYVIENRRRFAAWLTYN